MMASILCTTSTSTDGADVPMPIKQEPDDGPPAVLHSDYSDVQFSDQQHLADHKICNLEDCKDDCMPIINIAPIATNRGCSIKPEEDNVIVKSESGDGCYSSETSTSMSCDVSDVTQNLYEVKNEFLCTTQTEIVHNNRLSVGSELVEVPGELDCKPEIVGNVNNFFVSSDVTIQTNVQHDDNTVNQKVCVTKNNYEMDMEEELALDSRTSGPIMDMDDSTDPDVVDEELSHRRSDVQLTNYNNVNKQLSTQNDVIGNVNENTACTNEDHNFVLRDKELRVGTIKSFSCARCKMHFNSMEELTSHCETHKTAVEHKCHVCQKNFARKRNLTAHLRIHSGERPFKCDVCDKCFTQKCNLTEHLRMHSGEQPFKCNVCEKSFGRRHHLTVHLRIHSEERLFKCHVCDKSFKSKSHLTSHLRIHSGERSFRCDACDINFSRKETLTAHIRRHNGERPFKCDVCGNSFFYKDALNGHLAIHSGIRPFKCDECDKRFVLKRHLTMHLQIHSGERPFQCDICDQRFTKKSNLTAHLRIHSEERPFKCDVCDKSFYRKTDVKRHMIIHDTKRLI